MGYIAEPVSLQDLSMLKAISEFPYPYLQEMSRKRSSTMDSSTRRCAFHILQLNSNYVKTIAGSRTVRKRACHRVRPYSTPTTNKVLQVPSHTERTRTKSENSDNENVDQKDGEGLEPVECRVALFKSRSLENIVSSLSYKTETDQKMEQEVEKTAEPSDVEFVSSQIKYLNVSNK